MSAVQQVIGFIETHCDLDDLFAEFPHTTESFVADRYRSQGSTEINSFTVVWADLVQLQSDLEREYREVLHANREHLLAR